MLLRQNRNGTNQVIMRRYEKGHFSFQEKWNFSFQDDCYLYLLLSVHCRISLNISCHTLGVIVSLKLVIQIKCSCTIVFICHLHVFQCQIVLFRLKGFNTVKHVYNKALGTSKFISFKRTCTSLYRLSRSTHKLNENWIIYLQHYN